jgi:hypothetical protein
MGGITDSTKRYGFLEKDFNQPVRCILRASGQFTQLRSKTAARKLWDFDIGVVSKIRKREDCIVST